MKCMQCEKPAINKFTLNLLVQSRRLHMHWPVMFCSPECREAWWQEPTDEDFIVPFYQAADHVNGIGVINAYPDLSYEVVTQTAHVRYTSPNAQPTIEEISKELEKQLADAGYSARRFTDHYFTLDPDKSIFVPVTMQGLINQGPDPGFMYDFDEAVIMFRQHLAVPEMPNQVLTVASFKDVDGEAYAFGNAGDIGPWWKIAQEDDAVLGESRPRKCRRHADGRIEWLEEIPVGWSSGTRTE